MYYNVNIISRLDFIRLCESRLDSYKTAGGLGEFSPPWHLTNCASYDMLAKVTSPRGLYKVLTGLYKVLKHLLSTSLRGLYKVLKGLYIQYNTTIIQPFKSAIYVF